MTHRIKERLGVAADFPDELLEDTRFPTGYRHPQDDMEGKGEKGKRCNVNACQRPDSAFFYHRVMRKHYCLHCARDIQEANPFDHFFDEFFTDPAKAIADNMR